MKRYYYSLLLTLLPLIVFAQVHDTLSPEMKNRVMVRKVLSQDTAGGAAGTVTGKVEPGIIQHDSLEFSGMETEMRPKPAAKTLAVFPNPASGILLVDLPEKYIGRVSLKVFDMTGKTVLTRELPEPKSTIALDVSSLPDGIYFLSLKAGDEIYYQRFVCS